MLHYWVATSPANSDNRPQKIRAAAGHQSQEWFRKSQLVILMYDVTHGHEEGRNDGAYSDNKRRGAPRDGEGQCAGCDRL